MPPPVPLKVSGFPCLAHFGFEHEKGQALRTLYTQLMLDSGFLAGAAFYPSLAHTDEVVALFAECLDEVFAEIADILGRDQVDESLRGPVAHSGFRRLT